VIQPVPDVSVRTGAFIRELTPNCHFDWSPPNDFAQTAQWKVADGVGRLWAVLSELQAMFWGVDVTPTLRKAIVFL
jgi:hypothetical protein